MCSKKTEVMCLHVLKYPITAVVPVYVCAVVVINHVNGVRRTLFSNPRKCIISGKEESMREIGREGGREGGGREKGREGGEKEGGRKGGRKGEGREGGMEEGKEGGGCMTPCEEARECEHVDIMHCMSVFPIHLCVRPSKLAVLKSQASCSDFRCTPIF